MPFLKFILVAALQLAPHDFQRVVDVRGDPGWPSWCDATRALSDLSLVRGKDTKQFSWWYPSGACGEQRIPRRDRSILIAYRSAAIWQVG